MDKFGLNYQLQVGTEDGSILTIEPPFSISFDIIRRTLGSDNICQINIYNLSQKNRNRLRFDQSNQGEYRPVSLLAGYGSRIRQIFTGNVSQAMSGRASGSNDVVTTIESFDGGFAFNNGIVTRTFPKGSDQKEVIKDLIKSLPYVKLGSVGDYSGTLSRANSYCGVTADILYEITGGGFFIDNGKGNALKPDEYISTGAPTLVISSKSGLLGTPLLEKYIAHFDMLFEPALEPGTQIKLDSLTETNFNASNNFDGLYKVTGVKHRGMISESVKSGVTTTGEFFFSKLLIRAE